ncbi:anti-sigma regulatory factor [Leptospira perolatii]|uniref:Anti-sigma regulatory factor n=1 Tax=Leptospira perolatii TaxID=2023191 RepID=A0A2M9ZT07_9LEPT|nr:anti-sigma regulatory factor [Leptospira perolatii]PJZ68802.1 anti-sigma regulatory factor [Leptospira perolatii]PJZ75237.1 anti-sigma regulatory factor [Leptospira perolatii]
MTFSLGEIESQVQELLACGLVGTSQDFYAWIRMGILRKFREEPKIPPDWIPKILETLKESKTIIHGKYNSREFGLPTNSELLNKPTLKEEYVILGKTEFQPMQYVRSRLEAFLRGNRIKEDTIVDLTIGSIEAVENAVKYGDGSIVEVGYWIENGSLFKIQMVNNLREFSIDEDIERGKFSSTATLMRGMMVMQKLFDKLDLEILEERKQALFRAEKKV